MTEEMLDLLLVYKTTTYGLTTETNIEEFDSFVLVLISLDVRLLQ